MALRPTTRIPTWATTLVGLAKIVDPGSSYQGDGLNYTTRPPAPFLNWLFNSIGQWIGALAPAADLPLHNVAFSSSLMPGVSVESAGNVIRAQRKGAFGNPLIVVGLIYEASGTPIPNAEPLIFKSQEGRFFVEMGTGLDSDGTANGSILHDVSSFGDSVTPGTWVAVTHDKSWYGDGAAAWTSVATPMGANGKPRFLGYGNSLMVMTGFNSTTGLGLISTSTDGAIWTARTWPAGITANMYPRRAVYGAGKWLAPVRSEAGPPTLPLGHLVSSNGTTWTQTTALANYHWLAVGFNEALQRWFAIGLTNQVSPKVQLAYTDDEDPEGTWNYIGLQGAGAEDVSFTFADTRANIEFAADGKGMGFIGDGVRSFFFAFPGLAVGGVPDEWAMRPFLSPAPGANLRDMVTIEGKYVFTGIGQGGAPNVSHAMKTYEQT